MVQRCAWGTCNADERYPDRLNGGRFIRFPTPKSDFEKCKRWIKACGRPHEQLNVKRINKHKAVCSKHFHGGNGPSKQYPDPLSADGSRTTPARKLPTKRSLEKENFDSIHTQNAKLKHMHLQDITCLQNQEKLVEYHAVTGPGVETQTECPWTSPLDMFVLAAENASLKEQLSQKEVQVAELQSSLSSKCREIQSLKKLLGVKQTLNVDIVLLKESRVKNVFKYYTGIIFTRFLALLSFLKPDGFEVKYESGRRELNDFQPKDALFLTLCRLRHGFGLKDMATRFGLSTQSTSVVFNAWIDIMYLKLGQLSIWPHRDTIIKNMPEDYRNDFPTTLIIIDGTEVKTQTPSALSLQSQLYSDYKSSTTLKGLIGCDPNGCLMFVSELFTGSISDKALTKQSGFYDVIKTLKESKFIQNGDAIMVDKGFNIEKEIHDLALKINIPPFASSGIQFSVSESTLTNKIAKHRIHIERLICKVKTYKILSHCIPTSLFKRVNKIWTVCCHLTLFQDTFVKDKKSSN